MSNNVAPKSAGSFNSVWVVKFRGYTNQAYSKYCSYINIANTNIVQ